MLVAPSVGSYWPQFLIVGKFAGTEMKICRGSPEKRVKSFQYKSIRLSYMPHCFQKFLSKVTKTLDNMVTT